MNIELYQFPISRKQRIGNFSPFCLKLELYLKACNLKYQIHPVTGSDFRKSPKGKLPYIKDGKKTLGDSALIIKYLKDEYQADLDKDLSSALKAQSTAFQAMIENHLGAGLLYFRWQDQDGWNTSWPIFFKGLPFPLSKVIPEIVRKKTIKALHAFGMGRHSKEEIISFIKEDLQALSILLGDKKYFFGDTIHTLDATAYGFLANFDHPINPFLKELLKEQPNLVEYVKRMTQEFFID